MENKEIIIDGVDVSGCEHALQGKHTILCAGSEDRALCDANKNCLYKKYKRKEQECERLKEEVSLLKESNSKLQQIEDVNSLEKCYLQQLDQLKKTNEELQKEKEELKRQHQGDKGLITSTGKMNYQLIQEYDKLKKCLTEIKEFIQSDYCTEIASCEFCAEAGNCLNRKILQKISECEVENE